MRRSRRPGSCASPIGDGAFGRDHVLADLAQVVHGADVRTSPDDITVFKSVGLAFEDLDRGPCGGGRGQGHRMMETADVVVVGGGVVGASTAYHLAAAGVEHVVLLERADSVATGSTGACAGGFRHQFSSRINIELSLASVPMIVGFAEEHGLPLDVVQDGYLFLVRGEQDWADFRAGAELQRSLGVDTQLLTPTRPPASRPASRSTTSWVRRSAPTTGSRTLPG